MQSAHPCSLCAVIHRVSKAQHSHERPLTPTALTAWIVPKLTPGNTYRAPNASEANPCQCSTVTFSVLASRVRDETLR